MRSPRGNHVGVTPDTLSGVLPGGGSQGEGRKKDSSCYEKCVAAGKRHGGDAYEADLYNCFNIINKY